MTDFYQKVATPQQQYVQSNVPNGPTVDVNAHAAAQNAATNSLGNAIRNLLGTGQIVTQIDQKEQQRLAHEHRLDIESDTYGVATYANDEIKRRAEKESKDPADYTDEEVKAIIDEASNDFVKSRGLQNKPYFSAMQESLSAKKLAVWQKNVEVNKEARKEKKYQTMMRNVQGVFKSGSSAADVVKALQGEIDSSVGFSEKTRVDANGNTVKYMPEIQDTEDNVKLRMVQPIVESIMKDKDPMAIGLLDSPEFKKFFSSIPDYENVINSAKFQVQSTVNKNRQVTFDRVSEGAHFAMNAGLFKTPKDVDSFINEQLKTVAPDKVPSTEDINRLKSKLQGSMQTEMNFQKAYFGLKKGDYTVLERSDLKKKEIKAIKNKFFQTEVGIDDMSPQGITDAIRSGEHDAQLKAYFTSGYPIPPDLEKWANTPPSGGVKGLRDKHDTFVQLNSLTQDTNTSTMDIFNPKEYGRMMFLGNLVDNIDSGVMDDKEALQVYSSFNNDLNKNVDSFGTFVSAKAADALKNQDVQDWLNKVSVDAPWTYDEFSSQAYMKRQFKNYFSYAMESTDDVGKAQDMAEEMFYRRHTPFENPDGSEGVIPHEFSQFKVKDFVDLANEMPEFQPLKEAAGYLGMLKQYDFNSNLSFKPDPSYEKNKLMNFYYDGKFILSMDADKMETNMGILGRRKIKQAEQRNISKTQGTK